MPFDESMVISRTRLDNGAVLVKLRPVPRDESSDITAQPGRGRTLVRVPGCDGICIAVRHTQAEQFDPHDPVHTKRP